jgi:site-specific DNA-cytosine methylase
MDEILQQVGERIRSLGLTTREAAEQIGVTLTSLERHLAGAYVRSDSLARYRAWLAGRRTAAKPAASLFPDFAPDPPRAEDDALARLELVVESPGSGRPYNVVDLFSGCGGMSLGFDLLRDDDIVGSDKKEQRGPTIRGEVFRTILALDIEEKVVGLQNENHPVSPGLHDRPARWVDVSEFHNEAEVLAFYLDHQARRSSDNSLVRELDDLPRLPLSEFRSRICSLDACFLSALQQVRSDTRFRQEYGQVDSTVFGQTSVIGFHEALALPPIGTGVPRLGPLVWAEHGLDPTATVNLPDCSDLPGFDKARRLAMSRMVRLWDAEIEKLRERTAGRGRGQLASSAGRIRRFLEFLATEPMEQIRSAWLDWRATREALREVVFDDSVEKTLRTLYRGDRRVDILLGGPPCQGFSRIGRGKIRSLREHHVHVETDPEAGDVRNLLLLKYVLFVSALEPRIFLFENVRHFQASVKTPEGTFLATEILHDAIKELSGERLDYAVKDRIIDCSRHLIPQTRERFVMVGVRSDVTAAGLDPRILPEWCLALPSREAIPLRAALQGLPAPLPARGQRSGEATGLAGRVSLEATTTPVDGAVAEFFAWIRQPVPAGFSGRSREAIDGHTVREARADDQAFFELLGPGRRWMDYRCDDSETSRQLAELIAQVQNVIAAAEVAEPGGPLAAALARIDHRLLETVAGKLDGSLPLRLLLESIPPHPGELHHHLLTPNYLAKREGNNGDWIARLHPDRPCKTIVSHMAKDTYAYVHPSQPRTLSVREAARVQTFPDWFSFGTLGLVDGFRAVGNAVPPLLSYQFARKVARLLRADDATAQRSGRNGQRTRAEAGPLSKPYNGRGAAPATGT